MGKSERGTGCGLRGANGEGAFAARGMGFKRQTVIGGLFDIGAKTEV